MASNQQEPENAETPNTNDQYVDKLAGTLKGMRENDELCNITITVGGRSFKAHRNVLAASSQYFRAMFSHGFKEGSAKEINIDGKPEIFELLLEYAYTGQMKIVPKLAFDIVEMACYMQFTDISEYLSQNMKLGDYSSPSEKINISSALKIYHLAHDRSDLKGVFSEVMRYLCDSVEELKETEEFLETADRCFMDEFLGQDSLACSEAEKDLEIMILDLVVTWLKHDWDNRQSHAIHLLQKVHLGLVPGEKLKSAIDGQFLEILKCRDLLQKVLELQESGDSVIKLCYEYPKLFGSRTTVTVPVLLSIDSKVTGERPGYQDNSTFKFYYFHMKNKTWAFLEHLPPPPQEVATLLAVGDTLYAVGGHRERHEDETTPRLMFCWNRTNEENDWRELPVMATCRGIGKFQMVYLDGYIYTLGSPCWIRTDDVERFNIASESWESLSPIPTPFPGGHCASAVVVDGKILTLVTYQFSDTNYIRHDIFAYDPDAASWQTAYSKQQTSLEHGEQDHDGFVLFVHRGILYRIIYATPPGEENDTLHRRTYVPIVNKMNVDISANTVRVTEGDSISQDQIPANTMGAFHIHGRLFLGINGFVCKTGVQIKIEQRTKVDLEPWKKLDVGRWSYKHEENSNIVHFPLVKQMLQ